MSPDISIVAMPCWTANQPSHSLAIVGSIAKAAGVVYAVTDLNIRFYRHVSAAERGIWNESVINLWVGDVACQLWSRHENWLREQIDELLKPAPRIVAFTVNMWTRYFSVQAARYIKQKAPHTVILFGGVDCFVGEYNQSFLDEGSCDMICQGEAEIAFAKFLAGLKIHGWRTSVPGFVYHDESGKRVNTGRVELPTLKDPLPKNILDAFDLSLYAEPGRAPFFFSRGCPFSCRFCSETTNFTKFRCRVPIEAFDEAVSIATTLRRYADPPTLDFSDSIFNAHVNHLLEFARLVIESGISIHMGAQGHFHNTMTKEVVDTLAKAGFTRIFWGFESGSQRVVDLMKKAFRLSDAVRIIRDCSHAGIHQYLPVLVGFPGETPEDFSETVEFIIQFRETPRLVFFQPSPVLVRTNSELHEHYRDFGLINNEVLHWQDVAGANTYMVRLARCFVASQAQGNADLTPDGTVCLDYLSQNLNDPAVARDVFHLLRKLFDRSGSADAFANHVSRAYSTASRMDTRFRAAFDGVSKSGAVSILKSLMCDPARFKRIVRFVHRRMLTLVKTINPTEATSRIQTQTAHDASSFDASVDPLFAQWMATNKNSSRLRELIIGMTLDALRRLRLKHHPSTVQEKI